MVDRADRSWDNTIPTCWMVESSPGLRRRLARLRLAGLRPAGLRLARLRFSPMPRPRTPLLSLSLPVFLAGLALWLPSQAQDKPTGPEVVAKFKGHADAVYTVAYSADGKY